MKLQPQRTDRRAWLTAWLGQRRRKRIAERPPVEIKLNAGLIAHWGFDGPVGNYVDDVGGYILVPVDGVPESVPGILGNAVRFPYNGSYLVGTTDSPLFCPSRTGFTVSIWCNYTNIIHNWWRMTMVGIWNDPDWSIRTSWHLFSEGPVSGDLHLEMNGWDTGSEMACTVDYSKGWVHACLTFDSVNEIWTLYGNGIRLAEWHFGSLQVSSRLSVGANYLSEGDPPQGTYDELAIWSRALNAAEIAKLYNNGAALPYPYA